jgi:RNA polymerase sigma-70 factor (ECF subfamily)
MRVRLQAIRPARQQPRSVEPADGHEQGEDLWLLAQDLSENQYRALWLKYGEEMSIKEIARTMRRSQVNVKVLLHRARSNLLKRWNEEHDEATGTDV